MGKMKTEQSKKMANFRKAHNMAEAYAMAKNNEMLERFLNESGISQAMYGYYQDIQITWKKMRDEKTVALEAANVAQDEIKKQSIQNDLDDLNGNIDEEIMTPAEFMTKLKSDLDLPFGGAIALSYAIGYADHANGAKVNFYKPTKKPDVPNIKMADASEKPVELLGPTTPEHEAYCAQAPRIITDLSVVK
jgi:hypothetical protein